VDVESARQVQEKLRKKLVIKGGTSRIRIVAGLDAAYSEDDSRAFGVAVLYDLKSMKALHLSRATVKVRFPYRTGFLSFREIPALEKALSELPERPQALICDGQGILHPRQMGLAAHIGVLLDIPSVGCAKSRLVGEYEEPGLSRGNMSPIFYRGKRYGMAVRTRTGVKPVLVSPGHRMGVMPAARLVLRASYCFRLPEPVRLADMETKRMKREASK